MWKLYLVRALVDCTSNILPHYQYQSYYLVKTFPKQGNTIDDLLKFDQEKAEKNHKQIPKIVTEKRARKDIYNSVEVLALVESADFVRKKFVDTIEAQESLSVSLARDHALLARNGMEVKESDGQIKFVKKQDFENTCKDCDIHTSDSNVNVGNRETYVREAVLSASAEL